MFRAIDILQMKEEDVFKFLASGTHLGGTNLDFQMEQYIYKRNSDGIYVPPEDLGEAPADSVSHRGH